MPVAPEPTRVTLVPSGSDCARQPSVSVAAPVLAQCAACPMYVSLPRVKMKLAVHWPEPAVSVWMPGWMVALDAGAHADAAAGASAAAPMASAVARTARVLLRI